MKRNTVYFMAMLMKFMTMKTFQPSGFHRGAHQYAGEESFTVDVEEVEDPSSELATEEYYEDRLTSAREYLKKLSAKEACEGK
jgi:hypothetical protein